MSKIPLLNSFDPYEDFWLTNPQLKILFADEFKASTPSSHMWAVALFAHPDSKLFAEDPSVRKSLIAQDYLNDPTFDFSQLDPIIEKFSRLVLSKAQQLLLSWERRMYEREHFMNELSYSPDTFEMLEKMASATPKFWQSYIQISEMLTKEKASQVEGDIEESLTEKGEI